MIAALRSRLRGFLRPLSIHLKWRLAGKRIDRDQWSGAQESLDVYRRQRDLPWPDVKALYPPYARRAGAAIVQARGRVLELGCGIGNMTSHIAQRPEVESVTAVDGFATATAELSGLGLPKVSVFTAAAEGLVLPEGALFDTVFLCEFIEHLYPDEEARLLAALRPHLAPGAKWVVSVPVGWLEDPHHVRAFSVQAFRRHLRRFYGPVEGSDESSGYAQVAWGAFASVR